MTISFANKGEITPKGFTQPISVHEVHWRNH